MPAAVLTRAAIVVSLLLGCTRSVFALNPSLQISQYAHTSWKIRDGFLSGTIFSMTQTTDGYLWLGTDYGLYRFDGVRAVPWSPPGQPLSDLRINSLLGAPDGALWIGTVTGLITWRDGKATPHKEFDGFRVVGIFEDRDGVVWTSGDSGRRVKLCAWRNGSARCEDGGFDRLVWTAHEDRNGVLWFGVTDGMWRWKPGPSRFFSIPNLPDGIGGFAEDDDSRLLLATLAGVQQLANGKIEPLPQLKNEGPAKRILRDRDGGLWVGTQDHGLVHVHHGQVDRFGQADGLSGDSVVSLLEDREGNIWVVTLNGLDRFRDFAVATFSARQGVSNVQVTALVPKPDGTLMVSTFDGLKQWRGGVATGFPLVPKAGLGSIFQDSRGRFWAAMNDGFGYVEGGKFFPLRGAPPGVVHAIVEDARGDLWFDNQTAGLIQVSGERFSRVIPWTTLGLDSWATTILADSKRGGIWLGLREGGLAFVTGGRLISRLGPGAGLGPGRVADLRLDSSGTLWAATESGLSRVSDGRATTLTRKNGLPCDLVHSSIEDDAQAFWLKTSCGLVRIDRSQIDSWIADTSTTVRTTLFDASDGMRISRSYGGYRPHMAKTPDGRIWFGSVDGLSVVDPAHLAFNALAPPVKIEVLTADRKSYEVVDVSGSMPRLPAGTRDLEIEYTALSLVAPEKVAFRYRLEGWDRDWQDAGNRRQVFYSNLPPRSYRFRVIAANNSGVWNESGASLDFSVAPAFHQTTWFPAVTAGLVLALIWFAHRIRLRVVEKHEHQISALNERLMSAQEQERIRIAGELHDGVMQEMLAVTMMVGTAKRRLDEPAQARATLDQIQEKLVHAGTEIRQLSHDLHPPLLQDAGLPKAVHAYCEQFSAASGIAVSCECDESAHDLSRGAALALFRVVQEALGNAAKHAHATQIAVRLGRSGDVVSLSVSDNGVGFDPGRLGTSGGLGLVMMRERAGQLNGTFGFESAPGRGTTIRVAIPFR